MIRMSKGVVVFADWKVASFGLMCEEGVEVEGQSDRFVVVEEGRVQVQCKV